MNGVVTDSEAQLGVCSLCKEPVLACEERWVKGSVMYHHECLMDNASSMLNVSSLIAEDEYDV